MDCLVLVNNTNCERVLMRTPGKEIGGDFFEANEAYHIERFEQALAYDGDLILFVPKPCTLPAALHPEKLLAECFNLLF